MVHHVPAADALKRPFLPGSPLTRLALVSVTGAALAVGLLGVAVFGGFAEGTAGDVPSGTQLDTGLYTITPHAAEVGAGDLGTEIRVRADLELTGSEPSYVSTVGTTAWLTLEPGGTRVEHPAVRFVRHPEGVVLELQPHMREEAVLSWTVEDPSVLEGVTDVRITVREAEKIMGS